MLVILKRDLVSCGIERGKYQGGYTVFPQFGVGINLRNNDFVAMDVHQWHANTPMYETEEDKEYNKSSQKYLMIILI